MTPEPNVPSTAARTCTVGLGLVAAGALATELLMFAGAIVCLYGLVQGGRIRRREIVGIALFSYWILLTFLGFAYAPAPLRNGTPWFALHLALMPVVLLSWSIVTEQQRSAVLRTLVIVGSVAAVFACVQHFHLFDYPVFMRRYANSDRVRELADGGGYKAGGLHFHRLKHAHTVVPLLLAGVPLAISRARSIAARAALGVFVGVVALSLFYTYARAGWIAFAVGFVLLVVGTRLTSRMRSLAAITVLAGGALVPVFLSLAGKAPEDRGVAWHTAISFVRDHPLFGVGYGGYGSAALQAWGGANAVYPYLHLDAHALWLQIAAETGLVGLALVAALAVRFGRLLGEITAARLAVLGVVGTLGITHNLLFHPVVVGAVALALAIGGPDRDQRGA